MKPFSKILQKTLPFAFWCFTFFYLRKRLPDSLLKIDALSGLVRGGGARPPGALLFHHSAWSAQGPALSPSAVSGWTDHQSVSETLPSTWVIFQDPEFKCHRHLFLVFKWRIMVSGAVGWPWHSLPSIIYDTKCAVKRYHYQNVQHLPTMLESLHVLDLYFPSELSILKLPFFMKHPVGQYLTRLWQVKGYFWEIPTIFSLASSYQQHFLS